MKKRTLIPAVVVVVAAAIFVYARPTQEVFELPAGYTGPFVLYYDHPDGTRPRWSWGSRTYRIPRSGVCLTSASAPRVAIDRWVYVSDDGSRSELTVDDGSGEICAPNEACVRGAAMVSQGSPCSGAYCYSKDQRHWLEASIGRLSDPRSFGARPKDLAEAISARLRGEAPVPDAASTSLNTSPDDARSQAREPAR